MSTLLEIVQDMTGRQNIPVPATVFGTSDPQILQLMKLLEEEGNDLASRGNWNCLVFETSFTTVASDDQGDLDTLAPGFRYIKNQTIWDRTTRLPVAGPLDGRDWQALLAVLATGPRYQWRIMNNHLLVNPDAVAGDTWYFEYASKNWITSADGLTAKRRFTADTDLILLPEDLCLQGLRWRWLREKGMDYAELFRTYEMQVKDAIGRDGGKPVLYADGDLTRGPRPGIWISPYNSVPP